MKNNNLNIAHLQPVYTDNLKEQLKKKTEQFGDFSFDDDHWYCYKRHKNADSKSIYSLRFLMLDTKYKELAKYFALMSNNAIRTIQTKIYSIHYFFEYIESYHKGIAVNQVDRKTMNQYEEYLRIEKKDKMETAKLNYAAIYDFFDVLEGFPETPKTNPCKKINPFKIKRLRKDEKYIPNEVVRQYDRIMKNEDLDIPIEIRTVYWLVRSFPNRITEVLSLKQNCLKTLYSFYILNIPTYKQNGGYDIEEIKTVPIIDSGHGNYIVHLIKKMQEIYFELNKQNLIKEEIKDFLFLTTNWSLKSENGILKINQNKAKNEVKILTHHMFEKSLQVIAEHYHIRDKNGELYIPTSHQFRHNAITDRLYLAGYTVEQASKLTGHKNTAMLTQSYTHQLREKHKETILKTTNLKNPIDSPVEYKGRVMNLDEKTVKILSNNPKAYLTWEANSKKGVGFCSDILGCNPKGTSVHFECYSCDWFVPKAEYIEDYKKEREYWEKIIKDSEGNPKRAAHMENAIRNVTLLERIINICENGIEKYKKEVKQKISEGIHNEV